MKMKFKNRIIRAKKYKLCMWNKNFRKLMTRIMIIYSDKMIKLSTHAILKAKRSSSWNKSFGKYSTKKHIQRIRRTSIKVTRFERWKQLRN